MKIKPFVLAFLALWFASIACVAEDETPTPDYYEPTETPIVYPTVAGLTPTALELNGPGIINKIPMRVGYGTRGSFYEIYFTDPLNQRGRQEEGGLDEVLSKAIDESRLTIDLAIYSFNLDSVRRALLNAMDRGVRIRMVMESKNMSKIVPEKLVAQGVEIVGDKRDGLMHNKFMVIDGRDVWLGSMNYTYEGTYQDNNNLVKIRSEKIAANYTEEFEEMYEHDLFGEDTEANTPNPEVVIDNIRVETYFSPDDKAGLRILQLLKQARKSVNIMAFSFTTDDFGETLTEKYQQGISVSGVMEDEQVKSNIGSEFERFKDAGIPVFRDKNDGQMHHKVIIIDEEIVIFGSYNFSLSAERTNDENLLVIFDPQFASIFMQEFQRVYQQAQR